MSTVPAVFTDIDSSRVDQDSPTSEDLLTDLVGCLNYLKAAVTHAVALHTTVGAFTWTCPAGVYQIKVCIQGSGADGDNGTGLGGTGGGGGAGAYIEFWLTVVPGVVYSGVIGAVAARLQSPGNQTWFNANVTATTAQGGAGGTTNGGAGGVNASTATSLAISGQGGSKLLGSNGGAGGSSQNGRGGAPLTTAAANPGTGYGAGGAGGSGALAGGAGTSGFVKIEY